MVRIDLTVRYRLGDRPIPVRVGIVVRMSSNSEYEKDLGMSPRRFDEPAEVNPVEPASDDRPEAAQAALGELTRALDERGFAARIVDPKTEPPFVRATSREAAALSENVTCGPGDGGELWFRFSWGDLIAPVRHVESAAERVGHILTPQGVTGGGHVAAREDAGR
jgi:hypothetical protein